VFAVVITGPPGAGKTSVLTALSDALSDDDIPHAAVEVETLVWTHPALTDEQWARHVQAACELYREAGHRLLLVAHPLDTDTDVTQLLAAVGVDAVFLVRLEAQPSTLVERITGREPASWSGLPELVDHAQHLAASMPDLVGIDLVLSTEGQRPEDVAARIRAALPALVGRGGGGWDTPDVTTSDVELVRSAWDAFSRGDVTAAADMLDPAVRWYGAGEPDGEGACRNRDEAAAFIRRAINDGLTAELLDIRDAGDRLVAVIQTHAPPERERSPEPHGELITVRDGKITEIVVYPTLEDALGAAGLGGCT